MLIMAGYWLIPGGADRYIPLLGSKFAPRYSQPAFGKIKPGDSIEQVVSLIGQPLVMYTNQQNPNVQTWWYSVGRATPIWRFASHVRHVEVSNSVVIATVQRVYVH